MTHIQYAYLLFRYPTLAQIINSAYLTGDSETLFDLLISLSTEEVTETGWN